MTNIWSENKYIEISINILLFLLGINFMHVGQFTLPVICLLLFVDRKFRFKVNNVKIFAILCLFAVSFFIFSYKLGFYSVMGFTLPMAYYIGSNMNKSDPDSLKYVIYILAFGMATYLLINFAYELTLYPLKNLFAKVRRMDIWTKQLLRPTLLSVHAYLLISVMYYVLRYEKKKIIKCIALVLFVNLLIYNVAMARRTVVMLIGMSLILCVFTDVFYTRNIKISKKIVINILIVMLIVFIVAIVTCYLNLFGIRDIITNTGLYDKFVSYGFKSERAEYFTQGLKLAPYHLWGGQEISSIVGIQIHDFWSDIYDYAGIIPWTAMVAFSIYCIKVFYNAFRNQCFDKTFVLLLINIATVIAVSMMMEPAFTSTSVYVISTLILISCIEKTLKE